MLASWCAASSLLLAAASPSPTAQPITVTVTPDPGLFWATIGTAGAGLAAALAALAIALDWPRQWLKGPQLSVSISPEEPDCHFIANTVAIEEPDEIILEKRFAYYCRLRVENRKAGRWGRLEATNVEVQLIRLWKLADGHEELDPVFLPIRLVWSHVHGPVRDRIMPSLYNHADLLYIMDHRKRTPWLEFLTEVSPNPFPSGEAPNIKPPGDYRLELAVAASNAKTMFYHAHIHWSGDFHPTSTDAMREALTIEVEPAQK